MFQLMLLFTGSKNGAYSNVEISDCDTTKSACILKRNTTASITIDFTTSKYHVKSICSYYLIY